MMEKNLYRLVNSFLPVMILLLGFSNVFGIAGLKVYHFVLALMITVGLVTLVGLKSRGRLIFVISAVICITLMVMIAGVSDVAAFLKSYTGRLLGTDIGAMEWGIWHECMQVGLLSVVCFLVQLITEKFLAVKITAAAVLLLLALADMVFTREMGHIEVVCIWGYAAMVYVEWTQKGWEKEKTGRRKQYLVWVMPFLALYFLLMLLIPAKEEPYDWKFLRNAFEKAYESFMVITQNIRGGREDFEMSMTGFSEDGDLRGGLQDNNQLVMYVQSQKSLKTNVYLMGKVYDTFDGTGWEQLYAGEENDRLIDTLETIYAIQMYDAENAEDYVRFTKLDLYYTFFHTHYVFAPLKTWKVEGRNLPYHFEGGNLVFERSEGYGTSYAAYFAQINVDNAAFYHFAENPQADDEEAWKQIQKEYVENAQDRYSLADLQEHRQEIAAVYGQEIDLSEEMRECLDAMLGGATTDVEKLKAIEAALSAMTYTKTPGALPEDIDSANDFLEYFLLERKEGYCSYFATAFVLLARAEGIPARYVEGFCVPISGEERVSVYSDMAHAWPEAYIEGVGWIPFEPTPGYARIRYTPWATDVPMWTPDHGEDEEEETTGQKGEALLTEEVSADTEQEEKSLLKVFLFVLAFVIIAITLWFAFDRSIKHYRYKKWSLEKRILSEIQNNIKILGFLGYKRSDSETLAELQKRTLTEVSENEEAQGITLQFLHYYEEILYGKYPVTKDMLEVILEERADLVERLRTSKRLRYLYCKLVYRT